MDNNLNPNGPTIILGDLNCVNVDWATNRSLGGRIADILTDFVNSNGMTQCVNQSTHGPHILDLVLINEPTLLSSLFITAPFSTSDHSTVVFSLNFNYDYENFLPSISYNWRDANWADFIDYLYSIDWMFLLSEYLTVDSLWASFCTVLNYGIDLYVPRVTRRSNNAKKSVRRHPKNIRKLLTAKLAAWRRHRDKPENSLYLTRYKELAKECNRAKKKHVIEIEKNVLDSNNIGTFYKFVNKKLTHSNGIGVLIDGNNNNTPVTNDRDKAELLNSFFESVYIDDNGVIPNDSGANSFCTNKLTNITFSPESIYATITKIKPKYTIDPEGYSPHLLKKLLPALSLPLSLIFNTFISVSKIPQNWKTAIVTPIFKKGSSSDPHNYRPVSVTSVFCKVMERIIVSEITAHLYKNNLITSDQHGFLKQLSTCTNLLESVNDWTVLLEGGSKVAVAYVDFARAFDSVTHTKLLRKLQMYGISGDLLDFISFYLSNRNHCTRVGNSLSSFAKIRSGVIQGSCIGPLLFVLFINDITNSLCPGSKAKLFADDLKLYATIETALGVAYFQKCLDIIFKWSKDWQLEISYLKCFIILLDRRLNATFCRPIFKLGDHVLEYKSTGSDLGVNIDEKLSFTDHISKIAMKAHQRSSLILRSFTSRDTNSLVRAFKVYVRPILEYNSQVWSPIAMKDIMAIEKVQKRFTKKNSWLQKLNLSPTP